MKFKAKQLQKLFTQLSDQFCPFLMLDSGGNLLIYHSREDLYYDTLYMLQNMFPEGFINLEIFLYEMCRFDAVQSRQLVALARASRFLTSSEILWRLDDSEQVARQTAENILRTLHLITDTKFDTDAFAAAYVRLVTYMQLKHNNGK